MKYIKNISIILCLICIFITTGCNVSSSSYDLDIGLLKLNNVEENYSCSPLSIKTVLKILEDSSEGNSQKQISSLIHDFTVPTIQNDEDVSLTNGLFIKDTFSDSIKDSYNEMLKEKYDAELIVDSFESPDLINNWVKEKTYNMMDHAFDDVSQQDFIIVNTLAFDLDWINKIQNNLFFHPIHTTSDLDNYSYESMGPYTTSFENMDDNVNGLRFVCVANKYDLVNEVGEQNIRDTVYNAYSEWYESYEYKDEFFYRYYGEPDTYIENYIDSLKNDEYGFGHFESSTDFSYYVDDDVKVFAKELTEHNGVNLEYVAIMPINENLSSYIDKFTFNDAVSYISKLITPSFDNCEDGYVTEITGIMPEFSFDSSLDLKEVLPQMGVTDIFKPESAMLTKISDSNPFISDFSNKVNITLSNDGIKAAALTSAGGLGAAGPEFDYLYDLPTIKIDLTFDKPFLFLIVDKSTNDIWFEGTVYNPTAFDESYSMW